MKKQKNKFYLSTLFYSLVFLTLICGLTFMVKFQDYQTQKSELAKIHSELENTRARLSQLSSEKVHLTKKSLDSNTLQMMTTDLTEVSARADLKEDNLGKWEKSLSFINNKTAEYLARLGNLAKERKIKTDPQQFYRQFEALDREINSTFMTYNQIATKYNSLLKKYNSEWKLFIKPGSPFPISETYKLLQQQHKIVSQN